LAPEASVHSQAHRDLLKVPELQATEFALHDINPENLAMIAQIMGA